MSNARNIALSSATLDNIAELFTFSSVNQPYVYVRGYNTPGDGGGGHYSYINGDVSSGAWGTGSISGNLFYVVTTTNGTWANNQLLSGNGVASGTYIYNKSAPGVFNVTIPQTVPSTVMTGCNGGSDIVAFDGARWKLNEKELMSASQFGATINSSTDDYYPLTNLYQATIPAGTPSTPNPLAYDVLATNATIYCGNVISNGMLSANGITAGNGAATYYGNVTASSMFLTGGVASIANQIPSLSQTLAFTAPIVFPMTLGNTYQNSTHAPMLITLSVQSGNNSLWTVMGNVSPNTPANLTNANCVQVFYAGVNGAGASIINAEYMVPAGWYWESASSDGAAVIVRNVIYQG